LLAAWTLAAAFATPTVAAPSPGTDDVARELGLQGVEELDPLDGSSAMLIPTQQQSAVRLNGFAALELLHEDTPGADASTFVPQLHLATRAHVTHGTLLVGEIGYEHGAELHVDRVFIEVQVAPWLTLRAGRFYAPLSYERLNHYAPIRLTTTRPLLADIAFGDWTDAGIGASGRHGSLGWDVAVVNGPAALSEPGMTPHFLRDNNANKAVVARLSYDPFPGLEAGGAVAYGRYDPQGKLAFRNVELDARLRRGRLDVWFEYDRRDGDDEPCTSVEGTACDALFTGTRAGQHGAYLLAAYSVLEGRPWIQYLKPLARVEFVEELHTRTLRHRATAGLAWSPRPHVVAKAEYGRVGVRGEAAHHHTFVSLAADF
jgi:hypothetical protein